MADVFISYKTERRNAAQHLSRILELNGFSVWFDYGLLSGAAFGPQIEREVRSAKAVIVLWCRLSHDSHWVLEEAYLAERLGTLTPVWLEPVELPLGFGRADTIDLSKWDGSPRSPALDRLLNEVGRRVGRDPVPSYRGLSQYEETWRSFGAPPLAKFALLDPQTEEARAFGVEARINPRDRSDAAPAPGRRGGATRVSRRAAAVAGIAALAVAGGAAAWHWAGRSPRTALSLSAEANKAAPVAPAPIAPTKVALVAPPPSVIKPPAKPVNAPMASFSRSNSGWSVTLSFVDPVTAIAWRLDGATAFKETGFLDVLDPRTRRRLANPSFELDADQPPTTLEVRAVDADGTTAGPFPIAFDPEAELERGQRRILEMTASSWLSFRDFNGVLVYYTHLMSYRCAIREMRIGVGSAVPNKIVPLGACDAKHPYEIPSAAQPYLRLTSATHMVSVELTYRDGSVSEIKTFRR